MTFSLANSIFPMSELRSDPDKIKRLLKNSPVLITNKGKPDFGVCDLDTLELAIKINNLKAILHERKSQSAEALPAKEALAALEKDLGY